MQRAARSRGFLIVGATGFLGQRTCKRLLLAGEKVVVLLRSRSRHGSAQNAAQRLDALLARLGCTQYAASVALIDMDIAAIDIARLAAHLVEACDQLQFEELVAINLAASLKMDFPGQHEIAAEKIRSLNRRTNVEGLKNLAAAIDQAELLSAGGLQLIHFVQFGTAYAHGQGTGLLAEARIPLDVGTNNSYELTKRLGEHALERWHQPRAERTRLSIIRPSIVTGPDTPDGLGAWLNILSEPVSIATMAGWLRRFFRLEQDRYRLIDLVRAIAKRLPIPVPMLGNREGVLDLIDVDDVDRYSALAIHDARPPSAFPAPLYLHLTNPQSLTLYEVSKSVLCAAGCADIAGRLRIFRGFNFFIGLLSLFTALPFAGAAVRNLFKRTQMLRPYLMRPAQTRFSTIETDAYFRGLGCDYTVSPIDTQYLAALLAGKEQARVLAAAPPIAAAVPIAV